MTPDEIRAVVAAVLEEESVRRGAAMDEVVMKAVATILTGFGIEEEERLEFKADLSHLRRWRKSAEQAGSYGLKVIVSVLVTGFLGAVWMGVKVALGK